MYDNRHGSEAIVINCPGCGDRQIDAAMGTGGDVIISAEGAAPWSVMQTHAGGGVNRHPVADGYTVTGHAVIAAFEFDPVGALRRNGSVVYIAGDTRGIHNDLAAINQPYTLLADADINIGAAKTAIVLIGFLTGVNRLTLH